METIDENTAYLRWHITHLVRVWTALSLIRRVQGNETIAVFQDVCSDKLRIMLHELAEKQDWTLGFEPDGTKKHKRLFAKLKSANNWFTGSKGKNRKKGLHARNCSGAHLQPISAAEHMFQTFGYGGKREWKHLTVGVAACVGMMKIVEGGRHNAWWRELRRKVRAGKMEEFQGMTIPASIDALLLDYKVDFPGIE